MIVSSRFFIYFQLVAVNAESLVESMDKLSGTISKEWIALILLPAMNCIAGAYLVPYISTSLLMGMKNA
jgi:hypothetical protein